MGFIGLFYPWRLVLQVVSIVHFVRRRPDNFWLWVIIIGGGIGALVYIVAEVIPDVGLLRGSLNRVSRRQRIRALEAIVLENPAVGNREELADLCLEEGKFARARELYDSVITSRTDAIDPYYRRGLAELALSDASAALGDLERVVSKDPGYDLPSRDRTARACAWPGRAGRPGGAALPGRDRYLDALGDVLQLRLVSDRPGATVRSTRMGTAHPRQEADDATVLAQTRAAVVSQGQRAPQETARSIASRHPDAPDVSPPQSGPSPDAGPRREPGRRAAVMTITFPEWVVPMAATLTQERFTGPEWIFERKFDGIRLLAFKQGQRRAPVLAQPAAAEPSRRSPRRSRDCRWTT